MKIKFCWGCGFLYERYHPNWSGGASHYLWLGFFYIAWETKQ